MGHSKCLGVPLPGRKMEGNTFIQKLIVDAYQSLQKNKVLLVLSVSVKIQTRLNDAFKAIGACIKAITIRSIVINDDFVLNESPFLEVNLFREV